MPAELCSFIILVGNTGSFDTCAYAHTFMCLCLCSFVCPYVPARCDVMGQGVGMMVGKSIPERYSQQNDLHFFHIEGLIRYFPFCNDFGPYNLCAIFRFLEILGKKLAEFKNKTVVLCCTSDKEYVSTYRPSCVHV